ncbi:hypothetical protein HOLleu_42515 [Holothuria leucospilota]|uniref:Uncharacterized protein n=1 Tax=Holothuria leucospilota TaxID=206669 RepID=A0A9Q0YCL7_HOLLE|nr:hypothetical protein HOLleu_42515 [Holothuria leucospilota]
MGIQSFNAKYCLWCKRPSNLRFDTNREWSMLDEQKGARTVEEISAFAQSKGKSIQFGCASAPLFSVIPVSRVVPDTLHLFLRIADQLIGHILVELKTRDNLSKKSAGAFNIEKHHNIHKFELFIQPLGIEWMFCVDKASNLITARDFTGPELWKIMTNVSLSETIPDHPKLSKIEQLWKSFIALIVELKSQIEGEDLIKFQHAAKAWLGFFFFFFVVTPYMHVLAYHVPE